MAGEKSFEERIKRYFHGVGIYPAGYSVDRMGQPIRGWYTKIWGGGFQRSGIPDLLCCVNGVFLAIEIKAKKGRPSALQKINVARIHKAGGIALFLYPDGFDEFKRILGEVMACNTVIAGVKPFRDALSAISSTT